MFEADAIYNGNHIELMEPAPVVGKYKARVIFLEPINEFSAQAQEENEKKIPRSELMGFLQGKVWMSDDFNEPLEDLREYME